MMVIYNRGVGRPRRLQLRPVPPRIPESSPEPAEASTQQRSFTRAVVPKPPRDPPTNASQQEAGVLPSDRVVPSKVRGFTVHDSELRDHCISVIA